MEPPFARRGGNPGVHSPKQSGPTSGPVESLKPPGPKCTRRTGESKLLADPERHTVRKWLLRHEEERQDFAVQDTAQSRRKRQTV